MSPEVPEEAFSDHHPQLGASRPSQIVDNLKALSVYPKLTKDIMNEIEEILRNKPSPASKFRA